MLLVSCVVEVWSAHAPFIPWLGWPMVAVVALSTAVRWRCVTVLRRGRGGGGGVPLIHSAWLTAVVFSLANALVLTVRIRAENAALGCVRAA